jgi:hypothetical protein
MSPNRGRELIQLLERRTLLALAPELPILYLANGGVISFANADGTHADRAQRGQSARPRIYPGPLGDRVRQQL